MREFASPATRAAALPRPVKVLYTAFVAFTAAGLLTSAALYGGVVRFGVRTTPAELYQHVIGYYHPGGPPEAPAGEAGAPAQMTARKLLEVTHFHLFSMPMYLLVIGHLFLLTGVSARAKAGWISAAAAATAVHLFAPWGVYLGGAALAWLYPISGGALLVSFGVLMAVPVVEMWSSSRASAPSGRATAGTHLRT